MQAFRVTEFNQDLLTGGILVRYNFGLKDQVKEMRESFSGLQAARLYIYASARDWLLGALDDYTAHKKHIIEAGSHADQAQALKIVDNALADFHAQRQKLERICERTLKGSEWFYKILPVQSNPSYESSLKNLSEILAFCTQVNEKKFPVLL